MKTPHLESMEMDETLHAYSLGYTCSLTMRLRFFAFTTSFVINVSFFLTTLAQHVIPEVSIWGHTTICKKRDRGG